MHRLRHNRDDPIRSPRSLGFSSIIDAQTGADAASPVANSANAQQLPFAYARFSFAGNVILEIRVKVYSVPIDG